jgi:hypothetical protein
MRRIRTLAPLLLAGLLFGVLVAVIKGQDAGVRNALGNASAPWVVVPFLAGMRADRVLHGALLGIATTVASFFGFYVAEAAILDLGPHPWYIDLKLTVLTVNVYEKWGLVSGSVYGALGAVWASRRLIAAPIALGLAFLAEPLILLLLSRAGVWGGGGLLDHSWMWIAEVLLGVGAITVVVSRTRRGRAGLAISSSIE